MKNRPIILTVLMLILSLGSISVFAYAESGLSGMDLFGAQQDENRLCEIGDQQSCTIPLNDFDPPSMLQTGSSIAFITTDVEGNPINSRDLFAKHKITMVKVWATTCPHCISEIPELMKLNDKFKPRGAQVVGIVYDADETDEIREAEEIIEYLDVDYVNLLPNPAIWQMFRTKAFPSTFFVNDKGEILGEPVMGSKMSQYEELLNRYLDQADQL